MNAEDLTEKLERVDFAACTLEQLARLVAIIEAHWSLVTLGYDEDRCRILNRGDWYDRSVSGCLFPPRG